MKQNYIILIVVGLMVAGFFYFRIEKRKEEEAEIDMKDISIEEARFPEYKDKIADVLARIDKTKKLFGI